MLRKSRRQEAERRLREERGKQDKERGERRQGYEGGGQGKPEAEPHGVIISVVITQGTSFSPSQSSS